MFIALILAMQIVKPALPLQLPPAPLYKPQASVTESMGPRLRKRWFNASNEVVLVCDYNRDPDSFNNCSVAPGRTVDEVIEVVRKCSK